MAKLLHIMIRVADLARAMRFYAQAFGLRESHRMDFPSFTLVYLRNAENDMELELTLNKGQAEPYTHGSGYGHIAFAVDDIENYRARLSAEGLDPTPLKTMEYEGQPAARFFFVTDPDGYKIEVLAREGHYV